MIEPARAFATDLDPIGSRADYQMLKRDMAMAETGFTQGS
jgi:hypothetical protein